MIKKVRSIVVTTSALKVRAVPLAIGVAILCGTAFCVHAADNAAPTTAPASAPSDSVAVPQPGSDTNDLRSLIGVNPTGLNRVELPHLPAMSLRGYIKPAGKKPLALLEIAEVNRVFLVQEGTEIPIMVAGRLTPVGRAELKGLGGGEKTPAEAPHAADGREQSQVVLRVTKISEEGVTVQAGLLAQTIIIR